MEACKAASGIFVVGHTVKKVGDDLEHRLEEADLIASLPAEEAQTMSLQGALTLLLVSETVLPRRILLMPVIRRRIRNGKMSMGGLKKGMAARKGRNGIDRKGPGVV